MIKKYNTVELDDIEFALTDSEALLNGFEGLTKLNNRNFKTDLKVRKMIKIWDKSDDVGTNE